MTSSRKNERNRQRLVTILAELSVVASIAVALISIFGADRAFIIAVGLPLILFGVAFIFVIRRLYSITTTTVTIAIGGAPGVGKTVYINVLCNQLTEGRSGALSFIPETRTAQHVYRTIGNLQKERWPSTTGVDRIDYYRGTVGYSKPSLLSILVNGRQEFKVEFADSAGENWDRLASEANDKGDESDDSFVPRLIESSFFTYVGESDSLFYLIDSTLFWKSHITVAESVDDLLSTIALLRTIEGGHPGGQLERPISILLSKIDVLDFKERSVLSELISSDSYFPADGEYPSDSEFLYSLHQIRRLRKTLKKQVANYQFFMVSSLAAIEAARLGPAEDNDLHDCRYDTDLPLDWIFLSLRRLRRFRPRTPVEW